MMVKSSPVLGYLFPDSPRSFVHDSFIHSLHFPAWVWDQIPALFPALP